MSSLRLFPVLAAVDNAAVNRGVQVSDSGGYFIIIIFFIYPEVGLLNHAVVLFLRF